MSVAIRTVTDLRYLDDVNVTPAVGVDEYALTYDHDTGKFVLRAPAAPFDGTPYALLAGRAGGQTLYGGTAANDDITIHGTSDGTRTTSYVLLQPSGGNVGIGTTAPTTPLHVVSTTATTNDLRNVLTLGANVTETGIGGVNLGPGILFQAETSTTDSQDQAQIGALWTTATHATRASALTFSTLTAGGALTERMRIDGAGNVGIGTATPGTTLDVNGAVDFHGSLRFYGTDYIYNDGYANPLYVEASVLGLQTHGGNVGIGTTAPATALHVVGAATVTGGIRPASDSTTALQLQNVAGTNVLNVDTTNERVGINTTAPAERLDVTGNANVTGVYKVDDVQVLSNRVIDARCADVANSGDATTDGLIDALRDAMIAHGLIAAA